MAYISRTEPHNMFLEVSSRALITIGIVFVMSNADILRKLNPTYSKSWKDQDDTGG